VILNVSQGMNNFRLSTSRASSSVKVSSLEIESLLASPPLVKIDSEGRVWDIKTGKSIRETYIVEVVHPNGNIELFHSVTECAKSLGVARMSVQSRLDDGKPLLRAGSCKLRRIGVYRRS
jgi:hypothetical protein